VLIAKARRGHHVVRLKGGDPFVFGRGREEFEALEDAGIPCEIVPGVTSAIAGPGSAGIPVTHRGLASHVTIATGHESVGKATSVPWERLARVGGTLVVLMCSDRIEGVTRRLQRGGLAEDTPAAVVGRASRPDQEVRTGSLGTIARIVRDRPVRPPALLVVGEVAALARPERRAIPRPTRSARRRSA
jgi:uroporphyrin-III C-methyltransferase